MSATASLVALLAFLVGAFAGGGLATRRGAHPARHLAAAAIWGVLLLVTAVAVAFASSEPYSAGSRYALIVLLGLVCDTSGLLAALDRSDPDHQACVAVLEAHPGPFLLSPLVLAELDYLLRLRLGPGAARIVGDDVGAGAYELASLTATDIAESVTVGRAYGDLNLGLTDASLVVLAARAGTRSLITLDERHFRAVRPHQGGAFELLPADAGPSGRGGS